MKRFPIKAPKAPLKRLGANTLSAFVLTTTLRNFSRFGADTTLLSGLVLVILLWCMGEYIGLWGRRNGFALGRYSIIIESIGLFVSFFAISQIGLLSITLAFGFVSANRHNSSILNHKIDLFVFTASLALGALCPTAISFAVIGLLWFICAKNELVPPQRHVSTPQYPSLILSLSSGFIAGLSWLILSSAIGLTFVDHSTFLLGLILSHLLLPRSSKPWISSLFSIPSLLFCLVGLGFTHQLLAHFFDQEPWPYLFYLPAIFGIFSGSLTGLSISFNPWILRCFWIGFALSLLSSTGLNPVWFLAVFMLWGVLLSPAVIQRLTFGLFGLGFGLLSFTEMVPRGSQVWLSPHHIPNRDNAIITDFHWSIWGKHSLHTDEGMSFFVNESDVLKGWSNGFRISTVGRQASSEYFTGRLLSAWFPNVEHIAILGDFSVNLLSAYTAPAYQIHMHTPDPWLIQWIADFSEDRSNRLLESNVALHNASRRQILKEHSGLDLIIESIHTPFDTLVQDRPTGDFFDFRKEHLSENGHAVFILHTSYWPEGAPQAIIRSAVDVFPHAQLWLPPNGVDDLILIVGREDFDFSQFQNALQAYPPDNFLLGSEYAIASRAVASKAELLEWSQAAKLAPYHPKDSPALPLLHIGLLHQYKSTPDHLWKGLTDDQRMNLTPEIEAKNRFLGILNKASEGQIQDVFLSASELLEQGFGSQDALTTLVEPQLKDARAQIKKARLEGQRSEAWAEAARFATTARMLAPNAEAPLLLLGEIAIGQGQMDKAQLYYEQAYDLNPQAHATLDGLARIAGLLKDDTGVEKWLTKALELHPEEWSSHYNLGTFLRMQARYDEAEARLRKAISLSQSLNPLPHLQLATLYLDQDKNTRALLEVERALQIESSAEGWYLRGRAYFNLSQWKKAEDDFRRATLSDPNHHAARGAVGLVQIEQGNLEGAAQTFRAVLRFDPKNTAARENLRIVEQEIAAQEAAISPP